MEEQGTDRAGVDSAFTIVEDPSSVTDLFAPLQLDAAGSRQAKMYSEDWKVEAPSNLLITSPYNIPGHHLDLTSLPDVYDRIFALALAIMKPIVQDYTTHEYEATFNWDRILNAVKSFSNSTFPQREFYVVIFRSTLRVDCDKQLLWHLDRDSHGEAVASGGLLKYWFGSANEERRNLATCIWRNREDARKGGTGPVHAQARRAGRELYDQILFMTGKLVIEEGAEQWKFVWD